MKKEDIKNEIENFIIYHCGSNDEQLTYLLTCLDAYIDNDHIINDEEFNKENYYCENCFEEELHKPIKDKFGGIYCSEKCMQQCWLEKHNECVNNNLFN